MGRSRPIRDALQKIGETKDKVQANQITQYQKNKGGFICKECGVTLNHAGGNVPHFKLPKNKSHDIDCYYYLDAINLGELIKEVGLNNINIKINPQESMNEQDTKNKDTQPETEKNNNKIGTHTVHTITNSAKKRNFYMNKVERLFHVQQLSENENKRIFGELIKNKQYYSTKKYTTLLSDYESGFVNHPFFIVGYLHQKEYFNLQDNGYVQITDSPYNYGPIVLHIKAKNEQLLNKRINEITWTIKNSPNKTSYVGVLGEIINIKEDNKFTIIDIEAFDLDIKLK